MGGTGASERAGGRAVWQVSKDRYATPRTGAAGTLRRVVIRVSEILQVLWLMMMLMLVMMILLMKKDNRDKDDSTMQSTSHSH